MKFILKGNPQSTNHIYKHGGRHVYMTDEGHALKKDYQIQLKQQYKDKPISERVDAKIKLYFGDKRKRDVDNYNKIILDACSKILWDDDCQIESLFIEKNYDKINPRIELYI
jgi:crossover junction endodeoxyribonuclease RusA